MPLLRSEEAFLLASHAEPPRQTAPKQHFTAGLPPQIPTLSFSFPSPHLPRPGAEQTGPRQRIKLRFARQNEEPQQHDHLSAFPWNKAQGREAGPSEEAISLSEQLPRGTRALRRGRTQAGGRLEMRRGAYLAAWAFQRAAGSGSPPHRRACATRLKKALDEQGGTR